MLAKSNPDGRSHMDQTGHPVIRTLYDHLEVSVEQFIMIMVVMAIFLQ